MTQTRGKKQVLRDRKEINKGATERNKKEMSN